MLDCGMHMGFNDEVSQQAWVFGTESASRCGGGGSARESSLLQPRIQTRNVHRCS